MLVKTARLIFASFLVLLLGLSLVPAQRLEAAPPTKIVFTTSQQNIAAGVASTIITIQTQDSVGNPANVTGDTTVNLTSSSTNGKFDTISGGAFNGTITSVTISAGTSSANFYYKDITAGTPVITAASTGLTSGTQQENITPAAPTKIVFLTPARTTPAGGVSLVITVQTQDSNSNPAIVTTPTTINLTSTSTNGKFYSDALGTVQITTVTIPTMANSASFYYKDTTAATPTITAAENPSQGWTDGSQQETITAGAINKIAFITAAQNILNTPIVSGIMTIQTQDANSNPVNVAGATTVNLTSTSGTGTFYSDAGGTLQITTVTITVGTNSASFYYKDTTVGTPTITAAENLSQGWTDGSQQETIATAVASKIAFTTAPQTITAGNASAIITVQSQDAAGNPANVASASAVNLTTGSANGKFDTSATGPFDGTITSVTIAAGSNTASFYYKDTTATAPGTVTITATGLTVPTQTETINPAAPGKIGFTTAPINIAAGAVSPQITIQSQDTFGNASNVTANTTVNLTSSPGNGLFYSDAGITLITSVDITAGTNTANFYYKDTKSGTPTITAAENPSQGWTDGTQQETINPGAINKIVFTTAAQNINQSLASAVMTIQTQDTNGNPASVGGNMTVSLTSTSGTGAFAAAVTGPFNITSIIIGVGTNSVNIYYRDDTVGTPTITAAENPSQGWTDANQQETIVAPGTPVKLAFTTTAQTFAIGVASGQITVQTQDSAGNPANVAAETTVYLTSSAATTGKFDTNAAGPFNGTITTVPIAINTNATSFYYKDTAIGTPTITASSGTLTSATQQETITAGTPAKFVITTAPQTITAGAVSGVITVQTQDANSNPSNVIGATTVNLASTSSNGKFDTIATGPFNGSITSVSIGAGSNSASFFYRDTTAPGTPTITASGTLTSGNQQETINAGLPNKIAFTTAPQTIVNNAVSTVITVQTQDAVGNPSNVSANTTVNLTSSTGGKFDTSSVGPFNGTITSVTINAGANSASFFYKDANVGAPNIFAASTGLISGTQQETIYAGGPTLTLSPSTGIGGTIITVNGSAFTPNTSGNIWFDTNGNNAFDTGETQLTGVTTNGTGAIAPAPNLTVPTVATGTYHVLADIPLNGIVDSTANFSVLGITIGPATGMPGTVITINGTGFTPNSTGTVWFDTNGDNLATGEPQVTATTNASGAFTSTVNLTAPAVNADKYQVRCDIPVGVPVESTADFTLLGLNLNPTTGVGGTVITVNGTGFAINSSGTVWFDANGDSINSGEPQASVTTDASGVITPSVTLTVPAGQATGTYQVRADIPVGAPIEASMGFTVVTPSISLSPTTGIPDTIITVSGSGFTPNAAGYVWFDTDGNSVIGTGEPQVMVTVTATGAIPQATYLQTPATGANTYFIRADIPGGGTVEAPNTGFTVISTGINLNTPTGISGTLILINGFGFTASTPGTIWFDSNGDNQATGEPQVNVTTGVNGAILSGTAALSVPTIAAGTYQVKADIPVGGSIDSSVPFVVTTAGITLTPAKGATSSTISVSGSGFTANAFGYVWFDTNGNSLVEAPETTIPASTNASGTFTSAVNVTVPAGIGTGIYPLRADIPSAPVGTIEATAIFTVPPVLTIYPTSGYPSTTIAVNGTGFTPNATGVVWFDLGNNSYLDNGIDVQMPVTTTAAGAINSTNLIVPGTMSAGSFSVYVDIPTGYGIEASAIFYVSSTTTTSGSTGGGGVYTPTPTPTPTITLITGLIQQTGSVALTDYIDAQSLTLGAIQVTSDNGFASLNIPIRTQVVDASGAPLSYVEVAPQAAPPAPGANYAMVGAQAYECRPNGARFQPALALTIAFSPIDIPSGVTKSDMVIAFWDGSQWQPLATTADPNGNSVSTNAVTHFTTFAVLGKLSASPTPTATTPSGTTPSPKPTTPAKPTATASATPTPSASPSPSAIIIVPSQTPASQAGSEPPWILIGGGVGALIIILLILYLVKSGRHDS